MLVFVFGTLISGFNNNRLLTSRSFSTESAKPAKFIGRATTVGKFRMRDIGFPYIRAYRTKSYPVRGEVWDIGKVSEDPDARNMLAALDRLEGYQPGAGREHNHYTREELKVLVDGESKPRTANYYQATERTWERANYVADAPPIDGVLDWAARNKQRRNPNDIATVQSTA